MDKSKKPKKKTTKGKKKNKTTKPQKQIDDDYKKPKMNSKEEYDYACYLVGDSD